jgi:hypothetical protein
MPYDFSKIGERDLFCILSLLARHMHPRAVPYWTVHFLSSICLEYTQSWSSCQPVLWIRIRMFLGLADPAQSLFCYRSGSGSASFHQEAKTLLKPLFQLFCECDLFLSFYPRKLMYMYLKKLLFDPG